MEMKHTIAKVRRFLKKKRQKFIDYCESLDRKTEINSIWDKVKKISGIYQANKSTNISHDLRMEILNNATPNTWKPNFELLKQDEHQQNIQKKELQATLKSKKRY